MSLREGGVPAVRAALVAARERTLQLANDFEAALSAQGMRIAYDGGLNPPVWEWGHVAWFQEWWIARNRQRALGVRSDPDHQRTPSLITNADALYDSSRVTHRSRWELPLPDARGTREYLSRAFEQTIEALEALAPQADDDALYFFRLVALHELMHAEAATYMARTLGISVRGARDAPALPNVQLALPAQRFRLGAPPQGFAFDNELQSHEVDVGACAIDAQPVSWERFLPFVEAGGYDDPRWWDAAGLAWLQSAGVPWRRAADGSEQRRGIAWLRVQPEHTAIHLNAFEAQAWCNWAGRRLPTEAEWECAALTLPGFQWGGAWEWTASEFGPYPQFAPHPYRDYSQPWFGTRRVLRGACPATSPWLAHARYRNFFEPQRRDIFAGFRSAL